MNGNDSSERVGRGDRVIEAAKTLNTGPVKKRFAAFCATHAKYRAVDERVRAASVRLARQQAKVAEANLDQDRAIDDVAESLAADGFARANSFKAFELGTPASVKKLGYLDGARIVLKIAKAISTEPRASKRTRSKSKAMAAAALRVKEALRPVGSLERTRRNLVARRDELEQPWETAFAALRRAAIAAEEGGAIGLGAALFGAAIEQTKRKRATRKNGFGRVHPGAMHAPANGISEPKPN